MAAKKGTMDKRNILIVVLSLIICVETYFLYKDDPERFVGLFVHRKTAAHAKPVKKPVLKTPSVEKVKATLDDEHASEAVAPGPVFSGAVPPKNGAAKVVIILDDWGYSVKNCQYLKDIKEPLTVAVLPSLPHTNDVLQCAHEAGKEIMLHLPLEPQNNSDKYPEDYILTTSMLPTKVDRLLSDILDKMPYVEGVNNHMGSKATEDRRLMTTIFRQLKYRKLFFVDSRTASKSVCGALAKEMGLPFASRDVFLDNVNERAAIQTQLATLARIAKKRGWAVAIGHDRSLTLQVIQEQIALLKAQGIEFVTVKDIIPQ
jgi:polysaccharide deacetylase 2 family uncharacterized protein YibQ